MEHRTTSKLPWQIYFRLATGDINIFAAESRRSTHSTKGRIKEWITTAKKLVGITTGEVRFEENNILDISRTANNNNQTETTPLNNNKENKTENDCAKQIHLQVLDFTLYELSEDTVNLLMKGLTFTPAPPSNKAKLRVESSEFVRKLRLKEYFVDKNYVSDDLVRPKSGFTPKTGRVP